jgi:hypothetical protein
MFKVVEENTLLNTSYVIESGMTLRAATELQRGYRRLEFNDWVEYRIESDDE